MKVPSPTRGQTRVPSLQQSYVRGASNPGAAGQLISRGLGNLGTEVSKLEATFRQRDEQTNRFNALKSFSDFQFRVAEDLTELKRNYDPSGKGFADAAVQRYTELENEWIGSIPPELQSEFQYRSREARRGVIGDALEFQYKAGDAWFQQGVSDELNKAKILLDQSPDQLERQQQHISEIIDATDLPVATKVELKRNATIALAAVTYKAEIRRDPSKVGAIGIGDMGDAFTGASNILRKEEGFRAEPYWDVNAWRIGYGSDTITLPDGTQKKVTPGMRITREDAERDLAYRLNEREGAQARKQLGEAWNGLAPNVQAALLSVAYNYGSLPDTVVDAVKSGSIERIASAVAGLSANSDRRQREAAIILGTAGLDTDPRFAAIPYEDRLALRDDADREFRAEQVARANAAKAEREQKQNELYLGLLDGRYGQVDIDNARAAGTLDDYDSVNKALGILKDRDNETNLAMAGLTKIAENGIFDPTSTDDKKMLNAVVKRDNGLTRLQSGDQSYVGDLVSLTERVGDIPTDVAGTLIGMVRGGDAARAMFAYDALAQLRDANGVAFNQRVPDEIARQVDLWDARKDLVPQDELLASLRGGTTQAERQARAVLRKEAQDILTRSEGGVARSQALLEEAVGDFGGWFSTPSTGAPLARQALEREFNTLFIDEYSKTGDETLAAQNAGKALQRSWGVFNGTLMKFPPDKVGYRAINGSYDWINESIRTDLDLTTEESASLFSDEQTRQEFQAFQRDPEAPPPSYRVFIKDENGVYRERTDERGQPIRLNFQPPEWMLQQEAADFDRRERLFELQETINNYHKLQLGAQVNPLAPLEIPQEDTDAYNAALAELEELQRQSDEGPIPAQPVTPLGDFGGF